MSSNIGLDFSFWGPTASTEVVEVEIDERDAVEEDEGRLWCRHLLKNL